MKPLSKIVPFVAALSLNACASGQPAESPQKATTEIRTNVGEALAQIGAAQKGIQAGPTPNTISSVACGEGMLRDQTALDVHIAAENQLREYACPGDPSAYIPIFDQKEGAFGDTVCMRITASREIVCKGQNVTLEPPR